MAFSCGYDLSLIHISAAVVEDGRKVLSNIISSQIDIHTKFGGVVPEVASRKHIENISVVVKKALEESKCTFEDIDAIAVTYGPVSYTHLDVSKRQSYIRKKRCSYTNTRF